MTLNYISPTLFLNDSKITLFSSVCLLLFTLLLGGTAEIQAHNEMRV